MTGRRLYLFDIDGTLIATGGAGSKAMAAAFAALWRREDGFARVEFSGRTDRAILRDGLEANGRAEGPFEDLLRRFKRAYFRRLPGTLVSTSGRVLLGVERLLQTLADDPAATTGLATGNFRHSAGLKLRHYGISQFFRFGGFGDHVEGREEMVAQALRSSRRFGRHDTVFVIGDTVHDVRSAKAHGAVAVGVTTGTAPAEVLSAAGADLILSTLEEAAAKIV